MEGKGTVMDLGRHREKWIQVWVYKAEGKNGDGGKPREPLCLDRRESPELGQRTKLVTASWAQAV